MALDTDITIPELPTSTSESNNDLILLTQPNAQAETGYSSAKATMERVAKKILGGIELPTDLPDFPANEQNPLDALEYLNSKINDLYPVDSASGSIANFTTSLALPLVALKAYIQAQGGGGTPSSPVAITGFDSVKIYQRGVNLSDEVWELGVISSTTGGNVNDNTHIRTKNLTPIKPNTSYYVYIPSPYYIRVYWYDKNEDFISAPTATQKGAYTSPANAYYMRLVSWDTSYGTTYNNDISINYPSTDTQYHAYNPNSTEYTINLGQTVYGGYIDWKNGKLVVTHVIVDLGSLSWSTGTAGSTPVYVVYNFTDAKAPSSNNNNPKLLSDIYTSVSRTNLTNASEEITLSTISALMVATTETYADATVFKNAMVGHKLVYELATPIQTDITIPDITALVGENNIFADSGDIEVSFKQGVQEYIDKKIAETQALVL